MDSANQMAYSLSEVREAARSIIRDEPPNKVLEFYANSSNFSPMRFADFLLEQYTKEVMAGLGGELPTSINSAPNVLNIVTSAEGILKDGATVLKYLFDNRVDHIRYTFDLKDLLKDARARLDCKRRAVRGKLAVLTDASARHKKAAEYLVKNNGQSISRIQGEQAGARVRIASLLERLSELEALKSDIVCFGELKDSITGVYPLVC